MPECVPCCTTALAWARSFSWLLDRQHWASSPDEAKQLSETEDKDNKFNSRCHFIEHKDSCLARLQCFATSEGCKVKATGGGAVRERRTLSLATLSGWKNLGASQAEASE